MLTIGLTGGIGSGKSTVAALFAERGVTIIDADEIARTLTEPKQAAFKEIIRHFQEDLLLENGTLNRAKLRKIIFRDTEERLWLENLLHPLIRLVMQDKIQTCRTPYSILMIPLLLEKKSFNFIDRILVVDSKEEDQIERVIARDNISPQEAQSILQTQASRETRLEQADDIIINDGVLIDLIPQIDILHEFYLTLAKNK